jgi:RNase P protein component
MERVSVLNRGVRTAAKRALREYGTLTAGLRAGPDFVVIGAKRGGTTSLYNYLLEHPAIRPLFPSRQRIKGVHYFDSNYRRGDRWYRSHFPIATYRGDHRAEHAIVGEASPYYLFHPLAAERLAAAYADVKIIMLLRDPVERAYSHYKERVRNGGEPLSFADAIMAEPDRLRGEAERIVIQPGYLSIAHENHSYLAQGRYLDMLPRWFGLFRPDQFYIGASEDFYADPQSVVTDVWEFLGLAPALLASRKRYNYHDAADLDPALRARLRSEFEAHNHALQELLHRRLPWPSTSGVST